MQYKVCPEIYHHQYDNPYESVRKALDSLKAEWELKNGGRYMCLNGDKGEVIAAIYTYQDVVNSNDSENTQGWLSWITGWGSQVEPKKDDLYQGKKPILAIRMIEPAEPKIILIGEQGVRFDGSFTHGREWEVGNRCYYGDVGEVIAAGKFHTTEYIAIRTYDEDERLKIAIINADAVTYINKCEYNEDQASLARIENWNDDFDYRNPPVKIDPDSF